ncbi:hypothetical protein ABI59_16325 [Acidobacteria bacterium Mor1]|nr:hypothetical protein ABI59_16325 [Acidobacteria bacterium Mor1]
MERRWQIRIDTGGTFTDALGIDPDGRLHRTKVLSSSALRGSVSAVDGATLEISQSWGAPDGFGHGYAFRRLGGDPITEARVAGFDEAQGWLTLDRELPLHPGDTFELQSDEEAPVLAARILTGTLPGDPLPPLSLRLASTLGTNALLERRGARVALFITAGFADLHLIGNQQRPDLFALDIQKPAPLYERVVEVNERLDAQGQVLRPFRPETIRQAAAELLASGIRTAAISLMHAYVDDRHERALREMLLQAGFEDVCTSAELAPAIKLLERSRTAVVDAYLRPILRAYLDRVQSAIGEGTLHVMTSAGGLRATSGFSPKDSLLSGPAGGVVGAAAVGTRSGFDRLIGFDMGGTSTDVARYGGRLEYDFEHEVGDARLMAPALSIHTVAAGGGSICWFDGRRLRVGPQSAGARPGPACYGAGGPLTVTDANLLLGRMAIDRFRVPLRVADAEARADALLEAVRRHDPDAGREQMLEGLLAIADETMAEATRQVTLRRGHDVEGHALVAFGGAGGLHACRVAGRLGVETVLVPTDAGLLSAVGLGHALIERFAERQVLEPLEHVRVRLPALQSELDARSLEALEAEGLPPEQLEIRHRLAWLRFAGQEASVEVPWGERPLEEAFAERYEQLFGYRPGARGIELVSLRVVASTRRRAEEPVAAVPLRNEATPIRWQPMVLRGIRRDAPVHDRTQLQPGDTLTGPALVLENHATTLIDTGWRGTVDGTRTLILRRAAGAPSAGARDHQPEAVRLQLFTHRFRALALQMGERLRGTAVSTNVKERLDFSCALLDAHGELVVNAPHIPVHLGALGVCVRRVAASMDLNPGDSIVTNHPGFGGSHLPDVTVITPVFDADRRLLGYVASRAHHAEIGGKRPGSMPPDAVSLAEEGVVLRPMYAIQGGEPRWDAVAAALVGGPYPSRAVDDNLADLRAAVAANHAGAEALRGLCAEHGRDTVTHYMDRLKELAERRMREALAAYPDGRYEAKETLDDGTPIEVRIDVNGDQASITLAGSGAPHPGNLNATPAIARSAVLYVLRLMLRESLPLNEGLLRPVELRIDHRLLDPPFGDDDSRAPAVVGGNVETSQRLVDTLIKALGLAACSQGTMNNTIFGNDDFGFYETVCGGSGAGDGFHGSDAVHSHMTNTRITDPEILERRYPVRLERFSVRRGSGGAGRYTGGNGAVRELTFLAPVRLSMLTQHRTVAPYGVDGGEPGSCGAQTVLRADGSKIELGPVDGCDLAVGDRFLLETPGGGGFGVPERPSTG